MDPRIKIMLRIIGEKAIHMESALASASRLLGLSEPRLRRLFKREVGMALQRYLLEVKMTRAAKLSRNHALSIKEIAVASGYRDVSNFYRDFRKVYAQTPKQMRSQLLAKFSEPGEPSRDCINCLKSSQSVSSSYATN
jgi:AraC-like DNA-binding protein